MNKDLRDLERTWSTDKSATTNVAVERSKAILSWWVFTSFLVMCWIAAWLGAGIQLGRGLEQLYGISAQHAAWWQRPDSHLHALAGALATVWVAWGARLFTPFGNWIAPPFILLIIAVDELLQINQVDRSFEWGDPLAGVTGMILTMMCLYCYKVFKH